MKDNLDHVFKKVVDMTLKERRVRYIHLTVAYMKGGISFEEELELTSLELILPTVKQK